MRAALINERGIVVNVLEVPNLTIIPNLIIAETDGNIGDYWNGEVYIRPWDPAHPDYVAPPEEPPEEG